MTILLATLLLLALPILCWWGWYCYWKKNKTLLSENKTFREEIEELTNIRSHHQHEASLLRNELLETKNKLSKTNNSLSESYAMIRTLERTLFYFKKELPEEFTAKVESLASNIGQYSKDWREAETIKEEEERKAIRSAFLLRQEVKEKENLRQSILEKQRKRELEKVVTQELINEGELFPESNKRPPIPKAVVDALWSRDKGQCVYCASSENIHIDHIIPFSKGGSSSIENLQLLCQSCNLIKSDKIG